MKIKKTVVSVFFFLTIPVFYAQQFFFFKTSAGFDIDKDGLLPYSKAGIFFTTDTCFGGFGDVWEMPDVRAFCSYKFKFWTWDIYKSNLEPGLWPALCSAVLALFLYGTLRTIPGSFI